MTLINCEINLILIWSEDCVISSETETTKFKTTDTKLYVPIVTLSTQDNEKLLQQLKSVFNPNLNGGVFSLGFPLTLRPRMSHICGFLDWFSFSHFLATSCCF